MISTSSVMLYCLQPDRFRLHIIKLKGEMARGLGGAVSDASEVLVWHLEGECEVRAELLEPSLWHSVLVPSESRQPTAARSPGLNVVTAEPTLVTRPSGTQWR